MDSTSTHGNLVEEREELMVLPSECHNRPIIKKAHLLKPRVTTIDGSEAFLSKASSPCVKSSPLSVTFSGWRLPNKNFKSWFRKMSALHKPIWIKAGIFEAIKASTYKIRRNPSLILSLAHKWSPETKTFVFPWGEATITLEDVTVLLGFSVLGSSVCTPLESSEMKESVLKLEKRRKESVKQASWISSFEDDQMEHEAFLVFWLSNFVFPDKPGCSISKHVFHIAVRLARGERMALAPAVLASLYRDLGKVHALSSTQSVGVNSLFKLVQVWIWERFKSIGPRPHVIPNGEPRIARWSDLKQRGENVRPFLLDDFDWRPYTKPLRNWNPPRFYNEKAKRVSSDEDDDEYVSFARCMRVSKLEGLRFIEDYYPKRVAMQFGLAQDLPGLATKNRSNFTEKEAFEDYNRPLDGSKKHISSRVTTASVSAAKYRDWWMKSVSKVRKEPTETFNASNTVVDDEDDDDDVPLKVLPLSQVFQKLGDGMKKAEELTNKKRKRANEDDSENAMDCCETQDDDDEEDDNITIAQRIKCRTKPSDVNDIGDQRNSLEVDCNVSGLPEKITSDEHKCSDPNLASDGVDEKEEDDNNITFGQIFKSRRKCDNVENTEVDCAFGELEVDCNVTGLPQKLSSGDEHNSSEPSVASDGVVHEKEEDGNNITIAQINKLRKKCDNVENTEGGGLEEDNNVPGLPQKLASGDETVAVQETKQRSVENDETNSNGALVASNGIAENEEDDDERLNQRKFGTDELALKLEARMLKVEKTLAEIKQWKMGKIQTKTPVCA